MRQILTVCDPARKARIVLDSEMTDHSRLRHNEWGSTWDGYLKLAKEVWAGYLAYPVSGATVLVRLVSLVPSYLLAL